MSKNRGVVDVLVIDGFDRVVSGFDYSVDLISINNDVLAQNESVRSVTSCTNEAIEKGRINLADYHSVFWILGEESTADETFSDEEQALVKTYLENGGSLFVSGSEIGWDLVEKGSATDKAFFADYMKANFIDDGKSEYSTALGVSGTSFSNITFDFSKLWTINYPDVISANGGSTEIFKYNNTSFSGVAYKGTFGSSSTKGGLVFLSFPIETANVSDIKTVINTTLDYFQELVKNTAPMTYADDAQVIGEMEVEIDVLSNDVDGDNDIDESTLKIVEEPSNGIASIENNLIKYRANAGFVGDDTFTYSVSDKTGKTSSSTTVTVKVIEGTGMPYETEIDITHPKRDMRATFLTTVSNLDWPFNPRDNATKQKNDLIMYLDRHAAANVNTVMFQVRPAADVLYKSNIEPWSTVLTGTQGQDPGYDPLEFAIAESHARGMDLHAWVNPYRTYSGKSTSVGSAVNPSALQIENQHPEWILVSTEGRHILNPGIPEVIDYVVSIVDEMASNYDIDGIHFDDYFYFYEGTPDALDDTEFENYNPDGLSKGDWRRANVDKLLDAVYAKIQQINTDQKKNIIFGVSPFGIWKNGVPTGISGMDAYNVIFADPISWLEKGYVDYLAPQLYWQIGGAQDYNTLASWWNDRVAENNRYNMPSQATYHLADYKNWESKEILDQIAINRDEANKNTLGQIFFRSIYLAINKKDIKDELLKESYQYPSVAASYVWKEDIVPNAPASLTYAGGTLTWTKPSIAADSDTARKYIIYRFNTMEELITDKHNGRRIVAITGNNSIVVPDSWLNYGENYICVSALDKNNNESELSNVAVVDSRPTYCDAKGIDASSEWIDKVQFHSTVNASGNNSGYADYTDKVFNLQVGAETKMVLTPGFSGSALAQHWKVFIDFNNDGDFDDTDETIFATTNTSSSAVSVQISLPSNRVEGVYRMRVMMKGTSSANDIDACSDVSKGEVEDYLVNLSIKDLAIDDIDAEKVAGIAFPNPFNDQLNFSMKSDKKETVKFVAYNYMGQVVYHRSFTKKVGENNFTINSSNWSQGVYLLLVRTESGIKQVHELIKN